MFEQIVIYSESFLFQYHELLIAKLSSYGFSRSALKLIHSYLNERQQRVKVNGSFSTSKMTSLDVPLDSVFGALLFNIYINAFFYLVKVTEICNYADDTTIFACGSDLGPI